MRQRRGTWKRELKLPPVEVAQAILNEPPAVPVAATAKKYKVPRHIVLKIRRREVYPELKRSW